MLSYGERAQYCTNDTAKKLFELIERKQTNLAVSPDVTTKAEFLSLAEAVADEICIFKSHIDIIKDFDQDLIQQLQALAKKHDFIIFEDRKFADIGNTVVHQYRDGIYQISDWAPIVNAHPLPGPSIVEGLKSVGLEKGHGLLLLAEMSTKGNLISQQYTQSAVQLAKTHQDFVIGFISMHQLTDDPQFIHMMPGIKFGGGGDQLGQNYITPDIAINERKVDVIIVGRDIYQSDNPTDAAKRYRTAGWEAYQKRLSNTAS